MKKTIFQENLAEETDVAVLNNEQGDDVFAPRFSYNFKIDFLRVILMAFVSLNVFGTVEGVIGNFAQIVSGFAPVAFFILSGFLVLGDTKECGAKIARTIGRSALTFIGLAIVYFGLNALFYGIGGIDILKVTPYREPAFWFEGLLFGIWPYPIGKLLWYVQALLYGYLILFVVQKCRLLRFDWLFFLLFAGISLATGEFAGVLGITPFGYPYLPRCFLTTALPYLFLGSFIRRKLSVFLKVDNLFYFLFLLFGVGLCFFEGMMIFNFSVLYTTEHFIGMTVMAVSLCVLVAQYVDVLPDGKMPRGLSHLSHYFRWLYYLLEPVCAFLALGISLVSETWFGRLQGWLWLIGYGLLLGLFILIGWLTDVIQTHKAQKS